MPNRATIIRRKIPFTKICPHTEEYADTPDVGIRAISFLSSIIMTPNPPEPEEASHQPCILCRHTEIPCSARAEEKAYHYHMQLPYGHTAASTCTLRCFSSFGKPLDPDSHLRYSRAYLPSHNSCPICKDTFLETGHSDVTFMDLIILLRVFDSAYRKISIQRSEHECLSRAKLLLFVRLMKLRKPYKVEMEYLFFDRHHYPHALQTDEAKFFNQIQK